MQKIQMYASNANPMARPWSELDFQARRAVVREREQELREMQNNIISGVGGSGPRVVETDNMAREARYREAVEARDPVGQSDNMPFDAARFSQFGTSSQAGAGGATVAMGMEADRPISPHELWAIEQKAAAELRETLQYFIDFPTPKNWRKVEELGIPFQLAWMTGRQRITLHGK